MEMKKIGTVLIGGVRKIEKDLCSGTDVQGTYTQEVDGIHFDGHRVLWGFSYEPYTYLKESELSGDEYRKAGDVRFFRNGVQVYEDFCREPDNAVFRIAALLHKLVDLDWDYIVPGRKIYWRETPCIIKTVIMDQGALILDADGPADFPDHIWAEEDWEKMEDNRHVKVDFLDPNIWWFRK